jgi:hypothetical protein
MRKQNAWSIAFLSLVALPLLSACVDGITDTEVEIVELQRDPLLVVHPEVVSLRPGASIQLNVLQTDPYLESDPPDPPDLAWTSNDPDVVEVSEDGWITALRLGETLIFADRGDWRGKALVFVTEDARIPVHSWR